MAAQINVYALLPGTVADLNDETSWTWVQCLTLPVDRLNALQFSQRPYKWIHYAIGVVIGAYGFLSESSSSPAVAVDGNAILPTESVNLYYHTTPRERRRMFPIDPSAGRTHITSSVNTPRRDGFREDVKRRDRRRCLLTGHEEVLCDAVHLLPHSKGDEYISTYTHHRSRDPGPAVTDIIGNIDSTRNGLFLTISAHRSLGIYLAFIMTPNFAMNTTDIDPAAPPTEKRCTSHVFTTDGPTRTFLRPGFSLPLSNTSQDPPSILFDSIYATAVLHHFGTQPLKDLITTVWRDTTYPGGVMTTGQADSKKIAAGRAAAGDRKQKQVQERDRRYEGRQTCQPDAFDMLMILPYCMIPPSELQTMLEEAKEKAEALEQRRVQEKVDAWRQGTI